MNYEKPELTVTDAIRAIQVTGSKADLNEEEWGTKLPVSCYEDDE